MTPTKVASSFIILPPIHLLLSLWIGGDTALGESFHKFEACHDYGGEIFGDIDGCSESEEDLCEIQTGSNITTKFEFTSMVDAKDIRLEIFGIIGGARIPYPNKDLPKNICENLQDGECPIKQGDKVSYTFSIIAPRTSAVRGTTEIEFENEENDILACISFPVRIKL